jgi:hypothetical protein
MNWSAVLSGIGDIGIIGIIIYLILGHRKLSVLVTKNGGTMVTPESEGIDWIRRQGRFHQCDDDSPDRFQIMPGPLIPLTEQTHTRTAGGEYRDGSATGLDS